MTNQMIAKIQIAAAVPENYLPLVNALCMHIPYVDFVSTQRPRQTCLDMILSWSNAFVPYAYSICHVYIIFSMYIVTK